jgi:hypothetical protein
LSREIGGDGFNPSIFNALEKQDFGNQIATNRLTFLLTMWKREEIVAATAGANFLKNFWGMNPVLEILRHLQHLLEFRIPDKNPAPGG